MEGVALRQWLVECLRAVAYAAAPEASGKRDLRIDLLRGICVFVMIVDHVGGEQSWFYALTGGNRFFVSAAEGFVLLSGLSMGMVHANTISREGARVIRPVDRIDTVPERLPVEGIMEQDRVAEVADLPSGKGVDAGLVALQESKNLGVDARGNDHGRTIAFLDVFPRAENRLARSPRTMRYGVPD